MQKATKHIFNFLLALSVLCATALRTAQLFIYTDAKTGYVIHSAVNTIIAFYLICALIIILSAVISYKEEQTAPALFTVGSKGKAAICHLTAISFFYDFIHQVLNCYKYIDGSSYVQLNIIIPLALVGISALSCTYYFYVLGASFNSDKYDLRQLKLFHLTPAAWIFFKLLICIVNYDDKIYAEETFIQYAVLIFGIIFYILVVKHFEENNSKSKSIVFFGLVYSAFSLIISVSRIIALLFAAPAPSAAFSSITYLFTGIFALSLCRSILNFQKEGN